MGINAGVLTRPVGPLPLWGWGALAAGGAILLLARRGVPAAAALVDPSVATPAAPGDPLAAVAPAAPAYPPLGVPAGGTVYDPATASTTVPVSISDLLGGESLSNFIGKLGPDYQSFQLQDGALGTTVTHSAQNILTSQDYEAQLAAQAHQHDSDLAAQAHWADAWNAYLLELSRQAHGVFGSTPAPPALALPGG